MVAGSRRQAGPWVDGPAAANGGVEGDWGHQGGDGAGAARREPR